MNVAARAEYLKNLNAKLAAVHRAAEQLSMDYATVDVALADVPQLEQLERDLAELRRSLRFANSYR